MSQKLGENWEIVLFFLSRYQRFLDIGRVKGRKKKNVWRSGLYVKCLPLTSGELMGISD